MRRSNTAPVSLLPIFSTNLISSDNLNNRRLLLAIEFILVYIGIPAFFYFNISPIPKLPVLIIMSLLIMLILYNDPDFHLETLLSMKIGKDILYNMVNRFLISGAMLVALGAALIPSLLFAFPREHPLLWALGALSYPLLSVLPQEIIYRAFFFHRYKLLFPGKTLLIFANILAFSFVHIVYFNPIAVALTIIGGYFFSKTYINTGSFMITSIEHSFYGFLLFTIGLGTAYFMA